MLNFALSLVSKNNDYQRAQATAAETTASRLGIKVQTTYCGGDAIEQSQQLLSLIQSHSPADKIHGIIVQPAGTGLKQVADAAAAVGIGWVVLHKEVEYIDEILQRHRVPMFMVSSNHTEEGRIQGRQLAIILPGGGTVLCIMGPRSDSIAQGRLDGLNEAKPANIQVLTISGKWTDQSGYDAVSSWLRLTTSQQQPISAIVSQNDAMAIGVRRALKELATGPLKERLLKLPVIGCDGLPGSGQSWVKEGLLKATVVVPVLAGIGMELLAKAIVEGKPPKGHTIVPPTSYPPLNALNGLGKQP